MLMMSTWEDEARLSCRKRAVTKEGSRWRKRKSGNRRHRDICTGKGAGEKYLAARLGHLVSERLLHAQRAERVHLEGREHAFRRHALEVVELRPRGPAATVGEARHALRRVWPIAVGKTAGVVHDHIDRDARERRAELRSDIVAADVDPLNDSHVARDFRY